jgi:hypothetical protein
VLVVPSGILLPSTSITSLKIYFGTTCNTIFTIDNSPEAPEPASGALMFSGLLLAGWFGRKRLIRRSESTSDKAV